MSEKIHFTWHTFASHGQQLFRNLLETQEFSDVTLVSDDQHQYKVHKFILSECSTVFKNILSGNPLNTSIYLRGIHHEEIESILQFIYLGETTFDYDRMKLFLNVAKELAIKEIGKNVLDDDNEKDKESNHNKNYDHENSEDLVENQTNIELVNLLRRRTNLINSGNSSK